MCLRRIVTFLIQVSASPRMKVDEHPFMKDDRAYFLKRAEAQIEFARQAANEEAARAHYHLAGLYWDRAYNPAAEPGRRSAAPGPSVFAGLLRSIYPPARLS